MFQVAAAYAYSRRHNYELRLSRDQSRPFWHSFFHKVADARGGPNTGAVWTEPRAAYSEIPFNARNLVGRFQSSRYFADCAAEIRALFDPGAEIRAAVAAKYADLIAGRGRCIALWPGAPSDSGYYERAIDQMRSVLPGARLLILTTGPRYDLPVDENTIRIEEPDESMALHLMSHFRYFILSNDPSSWWAAWLASSSYVIAPRNSSYEYEPTWDLM